MMLFKLLVLKYFFIYKLELYPKNRPGFEKWQDDKVKKFIDLIKEESDFYSEQLKKYGNWKNLPYINKQIMMDNFDTLNTVGIKKEDAFNFAFEAENSRNFSPAIGDVTVGLSSGTSGNRGLFIVSTAERAMWVGYVLAKVLSPITKSRKIAFFLRANSNLYSSVKSKKLDFNYFDLKDSIEHNLEKLSAYEPHVLVAPPSMLKIIAAEIEKDKLNIAPEKIISVAEVLEESDKKYITRIFKQVIHQAYQCTEGFLASTCEHGTLHFNEDIVKIEKDYIDSEKTKFFPVITDFTRFSQPIIRYKLNDIIVEKKEPCPCGSVFTAIDHIEGRSDDIFFFMDNKNKWVRIFPDFFRKAVITTSENISDYIVEEEEPNKLNIFLMTKKLSFQDASEMVKESITQTLAEFGVDKCEFSFFNAIPELKDKKLQRIRKKFKDPYL